ncbi:MAG: hypothetical protein RR135_06775, partial [Oscillospiraceae bacterium]
TLRDGEVVRDERNERPAYLDELPERTSPSLHSQVENSGNESIALVSALIEQGGAEMLSELDGIPTAPALVPPDPSMSDPLPGDAHVATPSQLHVVQKTLKKLRDHITRLFTCAKTTAPQPPDDTSQLPAAPPDKKEG